MKNHIWYKSFGPCSSAVAALLLDPLGTLLSGLDLESGLLHLAWNMVLFHLVSPDDFAQHTRPDYGDRTSHGHPLAPKPHIEPHKDPIRKKIS